MRDVTYLVKKGRAWFAVVKVPAPLRSIVGCVRLTKTLKTRDKDVAETRKPPILARMRAEIAAAQRQFERRRLDCREPFVEERLRRHYETARGSGAIEDATGAPVGAYVETWLEQSGCTQGTKIERRRAVSLFERWLARSCESISIPSVTGKFVTRYRDEFLMKLGKSRKTVVKLMQTCGLYWKWLGNSEYLGEDWRNPWDGKSPPAVKSASEEDEERPFTDDEVAALLWAERARVGYRQLEEDRQVMVIGALSGMRLEAIFQLRVETCEGGVFHVRQDKTKAGRRKVPIHSDLAALIKRLSAEKAPGDYLISHGCSGRADGKRSTLFVKRFRTFRMSLGIHDMEGQGGNRRRSRVNFHSFRRWFATKCEQAGVPEHLTARVLGHKLGGMSYGVYSGGASVEQLRGVVEAVKLPARSQTGAERPREPSQTSAEMPPCDESSNGRPRVEEPLWRPEWAP